MVKKKFDVMYISTFVEFSFIKQFLLRMKKFVLCKTFNITDI